MSVQVVVAPARKLVMLWERQVSTNGLLTMKKQVQTIQKERRSDAGKDERRECGGEWEEVGVAEVKVKIEVSKDRVTMTTIFLPLSLRI